VLVWLYVWNKVQIVCMWFSWCHCHPKTPLSLASFQSGLVLPFWYRFTRVVLEKGVVRSVWWESQTAGDRDHVDIFLNWLKISKKIHEFYWILKMPTEFYFENQYFNFDWKITIAPLRSYRNTQQWQACMTSLPLWVKRRHIGLCKIWNSPTQRSYSMYTLAMCYCILLN